MSLQGLAFDFSLLPKVVTHAQLGKLGAMECSVWNPLSYPTCIENIGKARAELADAQTRIIDLATKWSDAINEINTWPDSEGKNAALADAATRYQEARTLVSQHAQVQEDFERELQPFKNVGLAGMGLGNSLRNLGSLGRMGIIPTWIMIALPVLGVTYLVAMNVASAMSLKSNYDSQAAYFNQFTSYYESCRQAAAQGKPCTLGPPTGQQPGFAWGQQGILIASGLALALLVFWNLSKR